MNSGCGNGDWAGWDPINLSGRSAATEPFTDFEVTVLRRMGITRSYSSGDVMAGGTAGLFGLGWHHNWETKLTCTNNGVSCTVSTGLGEAMKFQADVTRVVGAGSLAGETLVLYRRTEAENLAAGGKNLMVRRPTGEFVLFKLDGSEQTFAQPPTCGDCMDASFNGTRRLSREVDPVGRAVVVDFNAYGNLLTLTDELGNSVSLAPSSTCQSRAGSLWYQQPGQPAFEYVRYEYDGTCNALTRVVPLNYTPAPGKTAQLRAYEYQSTPRAGLLTRVRNEYGDPVVEFGYNTSGNATSMVEALSSLTVSYPQANEDVVVARYGSLQSTTTRYRDASGKAGTVTTDTGVGPVADEAYTGFEAMVWNGRYLKCSVQDLGAYVRYFQRDEHNRVTTVSDFQGGWTACTDEVWNTTAPLRSTSFEYGVTKTIAQGVTLPLEAVTKTSKTSVFGAQLAASRGGLASSYKISETLDYDPAAKPGDPAGYVCGTAGLPVGGLVCRANVEGYTYDPAGQPVVQKVGTFYSYDARGRLVRTVGPIYLVGAAPAGNVDPVEERTYWPDDDVDTLKRGRLRTVKRWPKEYPSATAALETTFLLYDHFGPTQVVDEAGGTTVYSRAGAAGRVTRIDTPDGRHVSTRFYDGDEPRLVLFNGGSARRYTYDERGRLHALEVLSGDPDAGPVTVGWTETRDYDPAGNTRQVTRADEVGVVRWNQQFEHNWRGELTRMPHPEAGKGYRRWTRTGAFGEVRHYWDEDGHVTWTPTDGLKRVLVVGFKHWDGTSWHVLDGGFSYEYEAGREALSKVSAYNTTISGAPGGVSPVIAKYVHDDFGRLLSVNSPYTMTAGPYVYAYDARGNVVKRTGGASTITWQYDGLNRVTQQMATRTADSSTITYGYAYDESTARGRLWRISEADRTTTFTYDEMGRTVHEVIAETGVSAPLTTEYRYDADGELSDVIAPTGLHVRYERDAATKDVTEVRNFVTGTRYASGIRHLPAGPITDLTFAGGATLSAGYNLRYEPIAIASGPVALSYTVSGAGQIMAVGRMSFTYDYRDRLETATPSYTAPLNYVYPFDTATWYGANDRPIGAQDMAGKWKYAFGYDDGSSLSAISTYDGAGTSLTSTTCLVHDALGRLTAVGPAKVLGGGSGTVCKTENDLASVTVRFRYDARNRRVARQDGAGAWKHWVFTSTGAPIAELTRPATTDGAWATQREYVWLDGQPLAQVEYPGPTAAEGYVYLVHVDHLGQPRALTSMTGATVWAASPPRPYGDMDEATSADPANGRVVVTNLRLPGQYDERLLAGIGLKGPFYNHNRWYLPTLARYLELDPIALKGGFNGQYAPDWYGYGNANPLRYVDRFGLDYTDINVTIGAGLGVTFGLMLPPGQGTSFYIGGGLTTPGISFTVTSSTSNISPGWNAGFSAAAGFAFQVGYGAIGRNGSWFGELGGGGPPGAALTTYYVFDTVVPQPPPYRPKDLLGCH